MAEHLVVCTHNTGYEASLELRKLYEVIPDADARGTDRFVLSTSRGRTTSIRSLSLLTWNCHSPSWRASFTSRSTGARIYYANPSGSPHGITGLTAPDGRFTILMPHPERLFRTMRNSWHPDDWGETARAADVPQRTLMGRLTFSVLQVRVPPPLC